MKRVGLALGFGGVITLLPWPLQPFLGDRAAILWLPGFAAISHWFPAGLHASNASLAKAVGCTANTLIWAGIFVLISYSVRIGVRATAIRRERF